MGVNIFITSANNYKLGTPSLLSQNDEFLLYVCCSRTMGNRSTFFPQCVLNVCTTSAINFVKKIIKHSSEIKE